MYSYSFQFASDFDNW